MNLTKYFNFKFLKENIKQAKGILIFLIPQEIPIAILSIFAEKANKKDCITVNINSPFLSINILNAKCSKLVKKKFDKTKLKQYNFTVFLVIFKQIC